MSSAIPKTAADIVELARYWRGRDPNAKDPDIFVSYLIAECALPPMLVFNALKTEWVEAAKRVYLSRETCIRETALILKHRRSVIGYLDRCVRDFDPDPEVDDSEQDGVDQLTADRILAEWDTLHTPEQVPAPQREAAFKRLRAHGVQL